MKLSELKQIISKDWLESKYFLEGKSQPEIAKILGCRTNRVSDLFKFYDLKVGKDYIRKYKVNLDYFDKWSSNLAYILGFITCDGYLSKSCLSIDLNENDSEILDFIMKELCPTGKVTRRSRFDKRTSKTYKQVHCHISSIDLVKKLNEFGITTCKTGKEVCLDIPKEFAMDYLRGIIDGDGSIYISNGKRGSIIIPVPRLVIYSACKEFLESLNVKYLDKKGKVRNQSKKYFSLSIEKREDIICILSKIYNGNFHLGRKYDKFLEILDYDKLMSTNKISIGTIRGLKQSSD